MPKLILEIELDVEPHIYGSDLEEFECFKSVLFNTDELLILHSNEMGDELGTVKVRSIILNPE